MLTFEMIRRKALDLTIFAERPSLTSLLIIINTECKCVHQILSLSRRRIHRRQTPGVGVQHRTISIFCDSNCCISELHMVYATHNVFGRTMFVKL